MINSNIELIQEGKLSSMQIVLKVLPDHMLVRSSVECRDTCDMLIHLTGLQLAGTITHFYWWH